MGPDKVEVVALNIEEAYPLGTWKRFWLDIPGTGQVLWAQDKGFQAVAAYKVRALGTTVIVDRQGRLAYRNDGQAGYSQLKSQLQSALN